MQPIDMPRHSERFDIGSEERAVPSQPYATATRFARALGSRVLNVNTTLPRYGFIFVCSDKFPSGSSGVLMANLSDRLYFRCY
jgi:hypothetical protein